jgi:hypothetical protein
VDNQGGELVSILTLNGVGALYEDTLRLGKVRYHVTITPPDLRGGITHTRGEILDGDVDLLSLAMREDQPILTLHMENDVRWDCRLKGQDGRLVPIGERLYRVIDGVRTDV